MVNFLYSNLKYLFYCILLVIFFVLSYVSITKPFFCLLGLILFILIFLYSIVFAIKRRKKEIEIWALPKISIVFISYIPIILNVICVAVSACIWIFISYNSYYHGLESAVLKDNSLYVKQAKNIFSDTTHSLQENIERFKFISSTAISGITMVDIENSKEYFIKDPIYRGDANQFTKKIDYESSKILKTDQGNFKFKFIYSVAPSKILGLFRAATCSLSDIFFTGGLKYNGLSVLDRITTWWNGYLFAHNWQRSIDFFVPLFICLIVFYIIVGLWERLVETNQKLEEFKTIHSKMYSDLSNEINQLKQPLQAFDFSWDNYVYTIFKAEKHDLENKLPYVSSDTKFSELETQMIDKIKTKHFDKQKETILKAIKELPSIVQYELKEETAQETLNSIMKKEEAIPLGFENGTAENFEFVKINNFIPKENEYCLINKHRLSSIIFNVLTNANVAAGKYEEELNFIDTYIKTIWMKIDRFVENNGDNFIRVSIEDNAGGIPNDKINKIYKKQIDSSKIIDGKKRKGEGTLYVAFFARYMKIKIEVENYTAKDGNKGAKVHLFIPIIKKGE